MDPDIAAAVSASLIVSLTILTSLRDCSYGMKATIPSLQIWTQPPDQLVIVRL